MKKNIHNKQYRFVWPKINTKIERTVIKQLHDSISVYDGGGIFAEFEKTFAAYHKRKFAVLCNSGTNAIHSMFVAANLGEGDEVICPAYTFFATVTPLLFTGAKPVLCDCDENGNIDPIEIESKINKRTKAVIVTHMWGVPAQMDKIVSICRRHHLLLLEDCSHAHGAKFHGRLVGTFGDMAAWSLQGPKIVTGGEGGIMLTNSRDFYERSLLLGHYNKRCVKDILPSSQWHKYAVTGMGLKYRAHPLAIAIASTLFDNLGTNESYRRRYARQLLSALRKIPNLHFPPAYFDSRITPSWYAFTILVGSIDSKGYSANSVVRKARDLGLIDVDSHGATKPLNLLPLFQDPSILFPAYKGKYGFSYCPGDFPHSEKMYNSLIKLPVGVDRADASICLHYRSSLKKILSEY